MKSRGLARYVYLVVYVLSCFSTQSCRSSGGQGNQAADRSMPWLVAMCPNYSGPRER